MDIGNQKNVKLVLLGANRTLPFEQFAVKQEYEKQDELKRSVWARPHPLPNLAPPHVASFERYMSILKSTYADQFAALPKSSKMYELLGSNLLFDKMAGNGKQSVEISKNILSLRFT